MGLIKNFDTLATSEKRKKALEIVEAGLEAIQPQSVLHQELGMKNNELSIMDRKFNLNNYARIFVVGFGKGSSGVVKYVENLLGEKMTDGWDIDVVDETFQKVHYTKGTHPLPSQINIDFTKNVLDRLTGLSEKDLVVVVICGGGSALFEASTISLEKLTELNNELLKSGANIHDMNIVRKQVSKVKGGKFAKHLYPAHVISLLFSDVPGNDLSVVASGPTVADNITEREVQQVFEKYGIEKQDFLPTIHDEKFFQHVQNILVVSNQTALAAMEEKAKDFGLAVQLFSDKLQGDAKELGEKLIVQTKPGEVLLAGGESTMKVVGNGKGGRNQALVLASLPFIKHDTIIIAFDSDGMDFFGFAGALGDSETIAKAEKLGLSQKEYLDNDDSYHFFEKVGDGIDTGKLESNVSDLFIVWKT